MTVASAAGLVGTAGLADYCASKFGAVGFNESLRVELRRLGKKGVSTTCVCPYYINTGRFCCTDCNFTSRSRNCTYVGYGGGSIPHNHLHGYR